MYKTLTIHTDRLILRPLHKVGDFERFYAMSTDPQVCLYDDMDPHESKASIHKDMMEYSHHDPLRKAIKGDNGVFALAICDKGNLFIGALYMFPADPYGAVEIGFQLIPSYWGKNYAYEAVHTLIANLFELGIYRVVCHIDPGNAASIKLVTKLGFTQEATLRGSCTVRGERRDELLFAKLVIDH